jgi:hypothetical protein
MKEKPLHKQTIETGLWFVAALYKDTVYYEVFVYEDQADQWLTFNHPQALARSKVKGVFE